MYIVTDVKEHAQVRKMCYQRFKKDQPEYAEFLQIWAETAALSEGDSILTEHGRLFRK